VVEVWVVGVLVVGVGFDYVDVCVVGVLAGGVLLVGGGGVECLCCYLLGVGDVFDVVLVEDCYDFVVGCFEFGWVIEFGFFDDFGFVLVGE